MRQLRRAPEPPALVHSLGYVGAIAARGPQVVTVHDLNYLGHQGRRTAIGRLIKKGFENARRFSWDKTARETLAVYSAVAS